MNSNLRVRVNTREFELEKIDQMLWSRPTKINLK